MQKSHLLKIPAMNRQRWTLLALVGTLYFLGGLIIGDVLENAKQQVPTPMSIDEIDQQLSAGVGDR